MADADEFADFPIVQQGQLASVAAQVAPLVAGQAAAPVAAPAATDDFSDFPVAPNQNPQAAAAAPAAPAPDPTVLSIPVGQPTGGDPTATPTASTAPASLADVKNDADLQAFFKASGARGIKNLEDAPGYANDMVRAAANAVPVVGALADKLDAATSSAVNGGTYQDALAQQLKQDTTFQQQNPVSAGVANVAGAAGGTIAMLPNALLGMGSAPLLARTGMAAAGGAGLGGADAAVRGQDVATGAAVGGIGGAAGPAIGAGAGALARALTNGVSAVPQALQGVGNLGRNMLAQGLGGATPEEMAAAAKTIGPQGFLGEMTPGLLDRTGGIADTTGPGKAIVRQAYADRNAGSMARHSDLMDQAFGPKVDMASLTRDTKTARSAAADPLYEAWRNTPVPNTPEISDVLSRPTVRSTIASAQRKAADQGRDIYIPNSTSGFEADPLGPSSLPEMPADMGNAPAFNDTAPVSRPGPVGVPRPQDLHSFIRSAGGLQDPGGDLASMGLNNLIAKPGQGLGPDAMRQAAAQSGYLGADVDHAMAHTDINDLFNAVGSDTPQHSVFDSDAVHAWNQRDDAMARYQQDAGAAPVARAAGPRAAPGLADPGPDGLGRPARQMTAEGLDYVKRSLDDKISVAQRNGKNDDVRIFTGLKNQLINAVDNHPDENVAGVWKQARQAWADPTSIMNAREMGQSVFSKAQRVDEMVQDVRQMSAPERQAYLQGTRDNVASLMDATTRGDTTARNVLMSPAGQAKLQALVGSEQALKLTSALHQEQAFKDASANVAGGSQTAPKSVRTGLVTPDANKGLLSWWNNLYIDKPSTYLPISPEKVMEGMRGEAYQAARAQIAPKLMLQGDARDQLLKAMMDHAAQRQAPINMDPLVRALAAARGAGQRQLQP